MRVTLRDGTFHEVKETLQDMNLLVRCCVNTIPLLGYWLRAHRELQGQGRSF